MRLSSCVECAGRKSEESRHFPSGWWLTVLPHRYITVTNVNFSPWKTAQRALMYYSHRVAMFSLGHYLALGARRMYEGHCWRERDSTNAPTRKYLFQLRDGSSRTAPVRRLSVKSEMDESIARCATEMDLDVRFTRMTRIKQWLDTKKDPLNPWMEKNDHIKHIKQFLLWKKHNNIIFLLLWYSFQL